MNQIEQYESSEFRKEDLVPLRKGRRIFVVFSTCGEREASLIGDKVRVLRDALPDYIDGILVSHRRLSGGEELTERKAREAWSGVEVLVCNDCAVPDMGGERGKGADMRRALYHINTGRAGIRMGGGDIVVFLDADVLPDYFGPHFVLGLSGALLRGHDFARASFWRAMGRIKKFVAQPLLSVIEHPRLRELTRFAYPLSGEVAGTLEFFNAVHFWQRYGVETGINVDASVGPYRVADVNLGLYDHEHHTDLDVQKMAFGIIRAYLIQLRDYGIIQLQEDAAIAETFRMSFIDESGKRQHIDFELEEIKYAPLRDILRPQGA